MAAIKSSQLDFVVNVMKGFKYPWFFAGGWSIDLGIGKVTRDHEDVDICIFREHALEVLSYFSEWTICSYSRGRKTRALSNIKRLRSS
jgi:hypothetical protein